MCDRPLSPYRPISIKNFLFDVCNLKPLTQIQMRPNKFFSDFFKLSKESLYIRTIYACTPAELPVWTCRFCTSLLRPPPVTVPALVSAGPGGRSPCSPSRSGCQLRATPGISESSVLL